MFGKNKGRYSIQVQLIGETEWRHFYSEKPTRSKQTALNRLYAWRDYRWHFTSDKPKFRVYDNRENEVYEDYEARAMRELGVDLTS